MHSTQVKGMLKGYANHAASLGYQRKGAVPLTEAEMRTMLSNMMKMLDQTASHTQLLLLRDGLLFSLLWQTSFRGSNAGSIRLDNLLLPTGENAVSHLYPAVKLPVGARLHLLPDHTKNRKGGHCPITLSLDVLCMSTWLPLAIHAYAVAGQPITNFITRPLERGSKLFAEQAMTCSNAWARLVKVLKEQDMYKGQSVHSTRRGKMIHQQQNLHASNAAIAESAMCNEANVKYYTNAHRPTK